MSLSVAAPRPPTPIRWLRRYFAHVDSGWISLFSVGADGERRTHWSTIERLRRTHWSTIERLEQLAVPGGADVWFGVATRAANLGTRRGGTADCDLLPALWLDLDVAHDVHGATNLPPAVDDARGLLDAFPCAPTAITNSGHGLQAFWLLTEPIPVADATRLLERWHATWTKAGADRGWHVDNVFDPARIMRLPGTVNHKADPVPVVLLAADWARTWGVDDIDQWLIEPPTVATITHLPYTGPQRPGDAFNASHAGADVLSALGWTRVDKMTEADGTTHWHRPGSANVSGATIYPDDGHTTVWSDSAGVPVRRPFDPYGLWTHLHHGGDFAAASRELAGRGYGTQAAPDDLSWVAVTPAAVVADPADTATGHNPMLIDWPEFWSKDRTGEDWLAWPLLPRGRQIVLYAPAKTGKSLLILDVAAALATGRPILGERHQAPINVLYLDYEMTEDDLEERLTDLGYGPDDDLSHLHYASLPSLPALDTPEGAQAVAQLAAQGDDQLVIVDTLGRAVAGDENDADTIRGFFRHTGFAMKQAQRTLWRADHAGKEIDKGQRGSSAKNDDVDVVWQATRNDNGLSLKRTHSRVRWVPETVTIAITLEPLRHTVAQGRGYAAGTKECADALDELGLALDIPSRDATAMLTTVGKGARRAVVLDALRWRREKACDALETVGNHPGNHFIHRGREPVREPQPEKYQSPAPEPLGNHPEPPSGATLLEGGGDVRNRPPASQRSDQSSATDLLFGDIAADPDPNGAA